MNFFLGLLNTQIAECEEALGWYDRTIALQPHRPSVDEQEEAAAYVEAES